MTSIGSALTSLEQGGFFLPDDFSSCNTCTAQGCGTGNCCPTNTRRGHGRVFVYRNVQTQQTVISDVVIKYANAPEGPRTRHRPIRHLTSVYLTQWLQRKGGSDVDVGVTQHIATQRLPLQLSLKLIFVIATAQRDHIKPHK